MVLEGGIREQRLDSALEVDGVLPAGAVFTPFGDVVKRFSWTPSAGLEARRGIGGVDALAHDAGVESHTATIGYLLQGKIAAGTPLHEAFVRSADRELSSRTIVLREKHHSGGAADAGIRTYVVLTGCKPASARIPGDPGTPGPITVEITYTAEKGRQYEISQPATASALTVVSTNPTADAGISVTIESDGGVQTETVAMGGTGLVVFASIDAISLSGECQGTVTVAAGTTVLASIAGKESYDGTDGDLGVPAFGATRVLVNGGVFEKFHDDAITHGGADLAFDINSAELSVDNTVTALPRSNTRKQRITEGNRTLQLTATVMGKAEYQNQVTRHLQTQKAAIVWTLSNTVITLDDAVLTSVGDKTIEEGLAYMQFDNTFEGRTLTLV